MDEAAYKNKNRGFPCTLMSFNPFRFLNPKSETIVSLIFIFTAFTFDSAQACTSSRSKSPLWFEAMSL